MSTNLPYEMIDSDGRVAGGTGTQPSSSLKDCVEEMASFADNRGGADIERCRSIVTGEGELSPGGRLSSVPTRVGNGWASVAEGERGVDATTVRLVLADDHPLILDGLEHLFAGERGYEVQARCSNGQEALDATRRFRPEILLLDLHMPGMDGISVARMLKQEGVPTRVVILTASLDEREALDCLRLGVAGIVLKDMAPSMILQCVDKVAAGDVWVEKRSFSRAMEHLLRREAGVQRLAGRLSDREMQVVRLCAQGLCTADIAKSLSLTEGTVKSHLHKAYQKLGVQGRSGLTRFAHENGLV